MFQNKNLKKKTKNRMTLIRNLQKGKLRKEARCAFQTIPCPLKYTYTSEMHRLPGDVIVMEQHDSLVMEASFYNNFKIYKSAQIMDSPGSNQKLVKFLLGNKDNNPVDWKSTVEKLENSPSEQMRNWANPVRNYCERYDTVLEQLQAMQQNLTREKLQSLQEMNNKTQKTRENIMKFYPCVEFKSQLKDGQIQLTEVIYSEKYLTELGYTLDKFVSSVLEEGIPQAIPIEGFNSGASSVAKLRLDKYLVDEQDGFQTPEFETVLQLRGGYTKNIKMKIHYHVCYEKGVPGFTFIAVVIAKQKSAMTHLKQKDGVELDTRFLDFRLDKEKEMAEFIARYYHEEVEQKYTNMHKVCKIREIGGQELF